MKPRTFWLLFALAAFLRVMFIGKADLWYDENFSLILSRLPLDRMLTATMGDVHPPLYYLLIWPLGQLDSIPAWTIRLPSVLFSLAALWLFWRVMGRLYVPARVQVIALALMVVLPFQIHYAQEARMYSLLEAEVLLALLCVLERRWFWLAVASVAMLYTQNYAVYYLPCIALAGLLYNHRSHWTPMIVYFVLAGIAWLPWMFVMFSQMELINGNYWLYDITPGSVLYTFFQIFWAFSIPFQAYTAVITVTLAWVMVGAWTMVSNRPIRSDVILLILAFGPILLAIVASLFWQPMLLFRPLIGVTPFVVILCAWPLARLESLRIKLFAAVLIVPMLVMGVGGFYVFSESQKEGEGGQAALTYIVDHWQDGDVLYHVGDGSVVNWTPYAPQLVHVLKPDCERRAIGTLTNITRRAFRIRIAALDEVPHRRAWVVWAYTPLIPQCEADQMTATIGDAEPVFVIQEDVFISAYVWLLSDSNFPPLKH
jgi:uncharacterized membrane protein